jgi:predicted MFS family arabinose efflux permease
MATTAPDQVRAISPGLTFACAVACGVLVANIYYAQPLIGLIAPDLRLSPGAAGLIVTLTQLGYAAGLLFVVPLADRLENRRLIVGTIVLTALALAATAATRSAAAFLALSAMVGLCSAGVHMVVPFAASMARPEKRGRTIGDVMSGLFTGIMLSRPVASLIAEVAGWRTVFGVAAAAMALLALWLMRVLPQRHPGGRESYGRLLRSMGELLLRERPLQRRALYHAFVFTVFIIFWTAVPLELTSRFGFHQTGIAVFALAGAAGALTAPAAGRLGDRGHVRSGTGGAQACVVLACLLAGWAGQAGSLALLVAAAILLDGATQMNQVLSQRVLFALPGEDRGRVNALYMTIVFLFGSLGGIIATTAYHAGGWWGAMGLGAAMGVAVLLFFATELQPGRTAALGPAPRRD